MLSEITTAGKNELDALEFPKNIAESDKEIFTYCKYVLKLSKIMFRKADGFIYVKGLLSNRNKLYIVVEEDDYMGLRVVETDTIHKIKDNYTNNVYYNLPQNKFENTEKNIFMTNLNIVKDLDNFAKYLNLKVVITDMNSVKITHEKFKLSFTPDNLKIELTEASTWKPSKEFCNIQISDLHEKLNTFEDIKKDFLYPIYHFLSGLLGSEYKTQLLSLDGYTSNTSANLITTHAIIDLVEELAPDLELVQISGVFTENIFRFAMDFTSKNLKEANPSVKNLITGFRIELEFYEGLLVNNQLVYSAIDVQVHSLVLNDYYGTTHITSIQELKDYLSQ